MPNNRTVNHYSPLIKYSGGWIDSSVFPINPFVRQYRDNSFHSTMTNGSTATFTFRGIAVYIFGAKRGNHGFYEVSLDGEPGERSDGYVPRQPDGTDGVYQFPLYIMEGLTDSQHTLVLTNLINGPNRPCVDIDYIVWTQENDATLSNKIIDHEEFDYSVPTSVWSVQDSITDHQLNTAHSTTVLNATASLIFEGSEVFLYGGMGPNHGEFSVQLDDGSAVKLNGMAPVSHPRTLLYTISGLAAGTHQLVIKNLVNMAALDLDYVEVVSMKSNGRTLTRGVIAGIIMIVVASLVLIIVALWLFLGHRRRRNTTRLSTELTSLDSYMGVMRSYSHASEPIIVEPFITPPGQTYGNPRYGLSGPPINMDGAAEGRMIGQVGYANKGTRRAGVWPGAMASTVGLPSGFYMVTNGSDMEPSPPSYDQIQSARTTEY